MNIIETAPTGINTDCVACVALNGLTQCNTCRTNRPNRQTLMRRELLRLISTGVSPADAEAMLNVTPCVMN